MEKVGEGWGKRVMGCVVQRGTGREDWTKKVMVCVVREKQEFNGRKRKEKGELGSGEGRKRMEERVIGCVVKR